jgi:asparagine synthase (glutamine-hydrolysing)
MCGIFALANYLKCSLSSDTKESFMKGKNRGPEMSILKSVSIDLMFGFHRLAINGLNKESNQPLEHENVTLICNGEIYNYKELYHILKIEPNSKSDCEVIIHLYKSFGMERTLQLLDGVFAFILVDNNPENTRMFVARDPYGVRPLYIMSSNKHNKIIGFASEMKMLNNICDNLDSYDINYFTPGTYSEYYYPEKVLSLWKFTSNTRYFNFPFTSISYSNMEIENGSINEIFKNIRNTFTNAVYKRCCTTERPIACLLSGGLDSSLVASLVNKYHDMYNLPKIETYSIGLEGSEDLKYARECAKFLKTKHTNIILTKEDFLNAIPEVIKTIESYDTTTVRASIGNYLVAKYISENSEAKVIFNGDGSDELFGGYLYMNHAKNCIEFDEECRRLLKDIHMFDVLRSDRSISSNGLEPRTPFLDKNFTQYILSIPMRIRYLTGMLDNFSYYKGVEKYLLRYAFSSYSNKKLSGMYLPENILWRTKEAFSDGVSSREDSLFTIIERHVENMDLDLDKHNYTHNPPKTKEQLYYRNIFEEYYPNKSELIPYYWMPKFVEAKDPSARTLDIYIESNYELQERSL